jgi:hypothetical protein
LLKRESGHQEHFVSADRFLCCKKTGRKEESDASKEDSSDTGHLRLRKMLYGSGYACDFCHAGTVLYGAYGDFFKSHGISQLLF